MVDENLGTGVYERAFNADGLASGMYWYRLESGGRGLAKKMIIMK